MNNRFANSPGHVRRGTWLILILTAVAVTQGCTTTRVSSDFDRAARSATQTAPPT
jgi:hypothetical protein